MNIKLLRKLEGHLRNDVPKDHFDLQHWFSKYPEDRSLIDKASPEYEDCDAAGEFGIMVDNYGIEMEDEEFKESGEPDLKELLSKCGTCACAIGWACVFMPEHFSHDGACVVTVNLFDPVDPVLPNASARRLSGFDAAQRVFDITKHETQKLFSTDSYLEDTDPILVADRIAALCNGEML